MIAPWATFRFHAWNVDSPAYPWDKQGFQPNVFVGVPLPNPGGVDLTWRQVYGDSLLHCPIYPPNDGSLRWYGADVKARAEVVALANRPQQRQLILTISHNPPAGYYFNPHATPLVTDVSWADGNQNLYPYRMGYYGQVTYYLEGTFDQVESLEILPIQAPTKSPIPIAPIVGAALVFGALVFGASLSAGGSSPAPGRRRRKS